MKTLALFSFSAFLVGCSRPADTVDENLTTETDGSTLVIRRKGVPIARITNSEDGFFAQVTGGDDKPDMNLYYYEDENSILASTPEVVSRNIIKDGEEWLITYDDKGGIASEGRLFAPNSVHNIENKEQNKTHVDGFKVDYFTKDFYTYVNDNGWTVKRAGLENGGFRYNLSHGDSQVEILMNYDQQAELATTFEFSFPKGTTAAEALLQEILGSVDGIDQFAKVTEN